MGNYIKTLFFVCFVSISSVWCTLRVDPLVDTELGLIRGLRASDGDYSMFMGIPYAQVNRSNPFGAAIPQKRFDDVFDAYDDTAKCPQHDVSNEFGSLDCLHLNVYVPNTAGSKNPLPVLVWIHGGGYRGDSGGRYLYGPRYLVRHDVIFVTINYRLGPYGFMCVDTPEVPGNQGLKDQLLALKWIKANIRAFGGNPNKITIFGESAGALSVEFHLISSHEKVFNSVIIQSGTVLAPIHFNSVKDAPLIMASRLGYKTDNMNDALSYLASEDIESVINVAMTLDFNPCVEKIFDGVDGFITENWLKTKEVQKVKGMPVLIGANNQESLMNFAGGSTDFYDDLFYDILAQGFDANNEAFINMDKTVRQFYIGDNRVDENSKWEIVDFASEFQFHQSVYRAIHKYIESSAGNIYHYVFSYTGGRNIAKQNLNISDGGAIHGDEMGYLFDISYLDKNPAPEDQLVIDRMTTMWANFAKYSNPTPELTEQLPTKWLPITKGSPHYYLEINSDVLTKTRPFSRAMAFWDLFYKINNDLQKNLSL